MVEEIIIFRNGVRTEWPEAVKNETVKSMSLSSSLEPMRDMSMMTKEL